MSAPPVSKLQSEASANQRSKSARTASRPKCSAGRRQPPQYARAAASAATASRATVPLGAMAQTNGSKAAKA